MSVANISMNTSVGANAQAPTTLDFQIKPTQTPPLHPHTQTRAYVFLQTNMLPTSTNTDTHTSLSPSLSALSYSQSPSLSVASLQSPPISPAIDMQLLAPATKAALLPLSTFSSPAPSPSPELQSFNLVHSTSTNTMTSTNTCSQTGSNKESMVTAPVPAVTTTYTAPAQMQIDSTACTAPVVKTTTATKIETAVEPRSEMQTEASINEEDIDLGNATAEQIEKHATAFVERLTSRLMMKPPSSSTASASSSSASSTSTTPLISSCSPPFTGSASSLSTSTSPRLHWSSLSRHSSPMYVAGSPGSLAAGTPSSLSLSCHESFPSELLLPPSSPHIHSALISAGSTGRSSSSVAKSQHTPPTSETILSHSLSSAFAGAAPSTTSCTDATASPALTSLAPAPASSASPPQSAQPPLASSSFSPSLSSAFAPTSSSASSSADAFRLDQDATSPPSPSHSQASAASSASSASSAASMGMSSHSNDIAWLRSYVARAFAEAGKAGFPSHSEKENHKHQTESAGPAKSQNTNQRIFQCATARKLGEYFQKQAARSKNEEDLSKLTMSEVLTRSPLHHPLSMPATSPLSPSFSPSFSASHSPHLLPQTTEYQCPIMKSCKITRSPVFLSASPSSSSFGRSFSLASTSSTSSLSSLQPQPQPSSSASASGRSLKQSYKSLSASTYTTSKGRSFFHHRPSKLKRSTYFSPPLRGYSHPSLSSCSPSLSSSSSFSQTAEEMATLELAAMVLGSISSPKTDRWKKKRTQNCVTKGKGKGKGKGRSSYVYDLKLSDSTDTSEDSGRVASFRHTDSTHTNTYTGENGSQRGRTQHEHKGSEGSPASPTSDNEEEDVHMSGQNDYGDGESHIQFKAREGVLGRPRRNSKKTKKVKELERQWAHQRR